MSTKRKIFLDLDGVMSGFDEHYQEKFGHSTKSVHDGRMWKNINSYDEWWVNMPKTHTHDKLWEFIKEYQPTILTGCPPSKYDHAAEGKCIWCEKHFGPDVPVITCLSRHKAKYLENEGDILIDDMEKNCKRWTEAGGHAIQFHPDNIDEVIEEIKALMSESDTEE